MPERTEIQSLRESAILLDGPGHDVLRATGKDRVSFLHRITSGKVAGLEAGQGGRTLLLDVRGHVLASLLVFVRSKSVRIVVPAGQGAEVAEGLARYAIMDDFQVALDPEVASLAVLGEKSAAVLGAVGVAVPQSLLDGALYSHLDLGSETYGPLWVAHGRSCGIDGLCVVAGRAAREAMVPALLAHGASRLSAEPAEVLRIGALEPKSGSEITPDRFPVEIGLGGAIDHGKGCYVGQETIVRMRDRGITRKRLVLLRLRGDDVPAAGDKVLGEGQKAAGQVTSAGRLEGEPAVALAIVATAISTGATVQLDHAGTLLQAEVIAEKPPWG